MTAYKKHPFVLLALLCLVVFSPNLLWFISATDKNNVLLNALLPGILGIALLVCLSSRLWLCALWLTVGALPAWLEAWYILHFGHPSSAYLFAIISESDSAETLAYLQGLWGILLLTLLAPLFIAILTIHSLYVNQLHWLPRYRKLIGGSSVLGLVILNLSLLLPEPSYPDFKHSYDELLAFTANDGLLPYAESWPTGLPVRFMAYWQQNRTLQKIKTQLADYRFDAYLESHHTTVPKTIVLVIGESSRPDHWQLFGYQRQTTPKLAELSSILLFDNVVSPWAWTRMAVPIIITRKPPSEHAPFFAERSLLSAFHEVGFQTAWLSNQSVLGAHESSVSLYAEEADKVSFYNPSSYKNSGTYDDVLIAGLERVLNTKASHKFIVLHTLGNHFNYTHRYPATFERFLPVQNEQEALSLHNPKHKTQLINAYDNSILFTDHILSEIIQLLQTRSESATLLYVADHGENLFDYQCGFSGHGHETERDFRVPMLFWFSKQFEASHPEKIRHAQANSQQAISTTSVFHSLLDLADIRLPDEDLTKSIFSAYFQPKMRWVNASGGIDFDLASKGSTCKLSKKPPQL